MKIKAGNSVDLLFAINDNNGSPLTNLSDASAIKFMAKVNETDADLAAKISKNLTSGITVDTPSVGNVKVSLTSANTSLPAGIYFMALQIEWGSVIQEVKIKESADEINEINTLNIIQDIIR